MKSVVSTPPAAFFSLAALLLLSITPARARDLLLRNAQLVDPAQRTITATDILIHDGRVAAPGTKAAADVETLDLKGKWVIPGLIDLHVHDAGNPQPDDGYEEMALGDTARRMLYCGVTAYLNLGTSESEEFFSRRDRQRARPLAPSDEADLYGAGEPFGRWSLGSPAMAPGKVAAYVKKWRPDVIKIIYDHAHGRSSLDRPTFVAAVNAARAAGVKTVVHISTWQDARDAIEAGAAAVTHFCDDDLIPDDLPAQWAKSGVRSIPTMAVQSDLAAIVAQPAMLERPLLRAVASAATLDAYRHRRSFANKALGTVQWQREDRANDFAAVRRLAAAGVTLLAGSDVGNLGTFQGYSLHREIKILQEAGLPAWDALAGATTKAADFLGRPHGIRAGEIAELVILDANPTDDVANTEKISGVVHHGQLVDRSKPPVAATTGK
ncbi:MAG: amidohydrolase family protein [Opitutae bacterium]|nr:amidohydrolase family protein [Opitutae bacterium]